MQVAHPVANQAAVIPEMTSRTRDVVAGTISVGIDFGTTFSGVSFGSSRLFGKEIQLVLDWPGTHENFRKIPTCIVYESSRDSMSGKKIWKVVSWGAAAKLSPLKPNQYRCEFFKLHLAPPGSNTAKHLPPLPPGMTAKEVISDFLRELWQHAKGRITAKTGSVAEVEGASVILTVPSAWNASGCSLMRQVALEAGVVKNTSVSDVRWRERLHIITEPEAAACHGVATSTDPIFQPPQMFVVCDAGGGTVDCAAYRIAARRDKIAELAEVTVRSGANCGSLFLDQGFEELLRKQLKDHPLHLDFPSRQAYLNAFVDVDKVAYANTEFDRESSYVYECWHPENDHDPRAGLFHGEVRVQGPQLFEDVFQPVIEQAVSVVEKQLEKLVGEKVGAVLLVGGFSGSKYLYSELQARLSRRRIKVIRPDDADIATVQGAAQYGLELMQGALSVVNIICPRSYMLETKCLAEPEDELARPAYISTNPDGRLVCDQRLLYLALKGSVIRKGQRITKPFRKRTESRTDSIFTANLKVSDEMGLHRYSDQAACKDFCSWTVDLKDFPPFYQHWSTRNCPGYVPFVIGLEMDSAEVKGLLLDESGAVWGSATFEYIE